MLKLVFNCSVSFRSDIFATASLWKPADQKLDLLLCRDYLGLDYWIRKIACRNMNLIWVVGFCMNLQTVQMWYCHCSSYHVCCFSCSECDPSIVDFVGWKYQTGVCRLNILITRFLVCVIFLELRRSNVILARSGGTVRRPLVPASSVAQVFFCSLRARCGFLISSLYCSFELRFGSLNIFFFFLRFPESFFFFFEARLVY